MGQEEKSTLTSTPTPGDNLQAEAEPVNLPAVVSPRTSLAELDPELVEKVMTEGDLSRLTPKERNQLYLEVCRQYGMSPLTRPMEYLTLSGKRVLYVRKEGADQLRLKWGVSVTIQAREFQGGAYVVVARASLPDGRTDESIGSVWVGDDALYEREVAELRAKDPKASPSIKAGLKRKTGDDLSNALMKAETKAKRRVTLSIVGLGWLDESQVGSIDGAREVEVGEDEVFISESQQKELRGAVAKAGIKPESFLKALDAKSFADLSVSEYKAALKRFSQTKKRGK